jgi:hypothetical protein
MDDRSIRCACFSLGQSARPKRRRATTFCKFTRARYTKSIMALDNFQNIGGTGGSSG